MAAPTEEEKQKLEKTFSLKEDLLPDLTIVTDFLKVGTLLDPLVDGGKCLVYLVLEKESSPLPLLEGYNSL